VGETLSSINGLGERGERTAIGQKAQR
jgi:hypothetical protein